MTRLFLYGGLFVDATAAVFHMPGVFTSNVAEGWWFTGLASIIPLTYGVIKLLVPTMMATPPEVLDMRAFGVR